MKLVLVRHAATPKERNLITPESAEHAHRVGEALAKMGLVPTRCLNSPAQRAIRTALEILDGAGAGKVGIETMMSLGEAFQGSNTYSDEMMGKAKALATERGVSAEEIFLTEPDLLEVGMARAEEINNDFWTWCDNNVQNEDVVLCVTHGAGNLEPLCAFMSDKTVAELGYQFGNNHVAVVTIDDEDNVTDVEYLGDIA